MKTLKFSADLVPLVLSGEKTSTWRIDDDKDLQVGDDITLIKRPELVPFCKAKILSVVEKRMGNLRPEDKTEHEIFSTDEEMYKTYSKYYVKEVGPDTLVKVVRFKVIEKL